MRRSILILALEIAACGGDALEIEPACCIPPDAEHIIGATGAAWYQCDSGEWITGPNCEAHP